MEWVRAAHPECHVVFVPGGFTAELQPTDISIQQPLKHIIKQLAMQFFAEPVCRDEAVAGLAQRWKKGRASQGKLGATSLGHSQSHQGLR